MRKSCLILLAFAGLAHAAPMPAPLVANMLDQVGWVMDANACAVANDTKDYGNEKITVLLPPPVGMRQISRNSYSRIRNVGYEKGVRNKWKMQDVVEDACLFGDALSDDCLAARSYFKTAPVVSSPPGQGVKAR